MTDTARRIALLSPERRALLAQRLADRSSRSQLVAYVVPTAEIATADLREYLGTKLPDAMVPSGIVLLDAFPLTPNGKIDRHALPPVDGRPASGGAAPRTPTEEVVAGMWSVVLDRERVGRHENFFDIGGQSLRAAQIVARVREVFAVDLPLRALFEAPTVAGLAARIEELGHSTEQPRPLPIRPVPRDRPIPLSFQQRQMWIAHEIDPSAAYNIVSAARIRGPLDVGAVQSAVDAVVRRQESLRTSFVSAGGHLVQKVEETCEVALSRIDLRGVPTHEQAAEVTRRAREEAARPFELSRAPLMRATLMRLAEDDHVLLLDMHHIVSDAWSGGVILQELAAHYEAATTGVEAPLPPLTVQYPDYAAWQQEMGGHAASIEHWARALAGAPATLELPTDHPRPAVRSSRGEQQPFRLSGELSRGLVLLGKREGATLYMTLLAAFATLLYRFSRQDDVVIGSPVANRPRVELEPLVGYFVNMIARRVDLSGDPTFTELLSRVRASVIAGYPHEDAPFEAVVEAVQPTRDPCRTPVFQVVLTLQNTPASRVSSSGMTLEAVPVDSGSSLFDLTCVVVDGEHGIEGLFEYSADLFDGATIARMIECFVCLLEDAVARPRQRISRLRIMKEEERRRLLARAAARTSADVGSTLHALFEARVREAPDRVAVSFEGHALTYGELDRRASLLARHITRQGVTRGDLVGVCLERSVNLTVAILGVLKAGAAYVPLDPTYPAERLSFMIEDAAAALIVSEEAMRGVLERTSPRVVYLDAEWPSIERAGEEAIETGTEPADVAYVIYTSGSTGKPKGVMVTHANVVRLFSATRAWFGFDASDVWTLFHSFAFDFSVWEIWGALLHGGRLVVVPRLSCVSPEAFHDLVAREGVTVLNQTPLAFQQFIAADHVAPSRALSLRYVILGGEALDLQSLRPWFEAHGDTRPRIVNMYGITETTVHVTYRAITAGDLASAPGSMIGGPIPDLSLHVLDANLEPVPLGAPGELHVGGAGLAQGYLRRPELTAQRFLENPFVPGDRLYKTGDLARLLPDGDIEYLGRIDQQVKLRGFRIELGEIEAQLSQFPGVRGARVLARGDAHEKRLVAYLVAEGAAPSHSDLRAFLKSKLPEYMVPSVFVAIDAFPLTANGKLDREALPAPDAAPRPVTDHHNTPGTPTEEALAAIWREILGVPEVGAEDNFFDLGGHSLNAIKTISRARAVFGVDLSVRVIFEGRTLAEVARAIDEQRPAATRSGTPVLCGLPLEKAKKADTYPLSPYQLPEWFMQALEPDNSFYNVSNSNEVLIGDLDLEAFAKAWQAFVDRHPAMRTVITYDGNRPVQRILPHVPVTLEDMYIDRRSVPDEDVQREMFDLVEPYANTIFDFAKGPLFLVKVAEFSHKRFLLVFVTHHIIWDEFSTIICLREISELYNAIRARRPPALPTLEYEYVDYAEWVTRALDGGYLERQRQYWLKKFDPLPLPLDFPTDFPRPAFQTFNGRTISRSIPHETYQTLQVFLKQNNLTLYIYLLAILDLQIYRLSGQTDFVVGTPIANRDDEALEDIIGMFATPMPMRCTIREGMTFAELLADARQTAVEAYENHAYPSILAIQELNPTIDPSRARLFSVMYGLQNNKTRAFQSAKFDDLEFTLIGGIGSPESDKAKFDFSLVVDQFGDELVIQWTHNTDLFKRSTIERMLEQFVSLVQQTLEAPTSPLTAFRMNSAEREAEIVVAFNDTARPFDELACVHDTFERRAAEQPDLVAVERGDTHLTYGALDAAANRWAHALVDMGVGLEDHVGLLLEPSAEMLIAILAVLKAGATYVPINPEHPLDRQRQVIERAGARLVVTYGATSAPPAERILRFEEHDVSRYPATRPERRPRSRNLAYVLFTSGTTGEPKGIEVEHRGLVNLIASTQRDYALSERDRVLFTTPYSFDASILELFWPLAVGARVVLAHAGESRDPAVIGGLVVQHGVTVLQCVPLMLTALVDGRARGMVPEMPSLRLVICGGSFMSSDLQRRFLTAFDCKLVNHYGPTEVTVDATRFDCSAESNGNVVPIGRPIDNTRVYVLDGSLTPAPIGVTGELYVGSPGLARGYTKAPAETARRFVPNPFASDGSRLYRTGDLARYAEDGDIQFVGRADKQVKVRGNRVELEEIEARLARHPAVARCAVKPHGDGLAAYVELHEQVIGLGPYRLYSLAQRPDKRAEMDRLHVASWPEYFLWNEATRRYWSRLHVEMAAYQFVLVDAQDLAVAVGNAVPLRWDGTVEDLPRGWDDGLARAFEGAERAEPADSLMILAGVTAEDERGKGLAALILSGFKRIAAAHGLSRLFVPVRPTGKVDHPTSTFEDYCALRRDDGLPVDNWLRSHTRAGGKILKIEPRSQHIEADLEAWARLSGRTFDGSGAYAVPGTLAPVRVDVERGRGEYWDPSIFVQHFHDGPGAYQHVDREAITSHMRESLPEYMIPEHICFLSKLPLTDAGKVNEGALPPVIGSRTRERIAPRGRLEEELARVFRDILEVEEVGATDDFFELGGHSIRAAQLVAKVNAELGAKLTLRDVFRERTVWALARLDAFAPT